MSGRAGVEVERRGGDVTAVPLTVAIADDDEDVGPRVRFTVAWFGRAGQAWPPAHRDVARKGPARPGARSDRIQMVTSGRRKRHTGFVADTRGSASSVTRRVLGFEETGSSAHGEPMAAVRGRGQS